MCECTLLVYAIALVLDTYCVLLPESQKWKSHDQTLADIDSNGVFVPTFVVTELCKVK